MAANENESLSNCEGVIQGDESPRNFSDKVLLCGAGAQTRYSHEDVQVCAPNGKLTASIDEGELGR